MVLNRHTDFGQRRVVVGTKGVELRGFFLFGAVATEQYILKINAHFGDNRLAVVLRRRNLQGRNDVFAGVGAGHPDGQLSTRQNHGFLEVLEHKTQRRGGVGHGVGAVQNHKTVVKIVVAPNQVP